MQMVKLLLVEDEFLIATLLQRNLQLAGYEVCELVSTGEEAVEWAKQEQPDLILMDIRLADEMNGIEAAREIHQHFQIPIIFLTGYSDEEVVEQARELNPLAYLVKPVTPDDIKPVIDSALKKDR
jgi:CheY-like chemotaxis protein